MVMASFLFLGMNFSVYGQTLNFKNPFISVLPLPQIPQKPEVIEHQPVETTARAEERIPEPEIVAPEFVVSGVIWNTSKPQAILNNQVVAIGDKIEGATILGIDSKNIEIEFNGKHVTVSTDNLKNQSSQQAYNITANTRAMPIKRRGRP